ncbi:MAG TPA: hypothetical protein VII51_07885 [Gaiellaceae bacterium]
MGIRAAVVLGCSVVAALALADVAWAGGGRYVIDGGTPTEQAQVHAALDASGFDWDIVPTQVTIHIVRGISSSYSTRGQIWLDANVLDAGVFSWGVVQMEYGQQVQFALLDEAERARLTAQLGASQWCYENPSLPRGDNGCERFSATLAWAYWPAAQNSMRPTGPGDWSASMNATDFRSLLARLIGAPDPIGTPSIRNLADRPAARAPVYPHGH